ARLISAYLGHRAIFIAHCSWYVVPDSSSGARANLHCLSKVDRFPSQVDRRVMGKLTVHALRAVFAAVLAGTVLIQVLMVWTLISGNDPEDGSLPLTSLRLITILGMATVQVALVCVWRL